MWRGSCCDVPDTTSKTHDTFATLKASERFEPSRQTEQGHEDFCAPLLLPGHPRRPTSSMAPRTIIEPDILAAMGLETYVEFLRIDEPRHGSG